MQAFIEWELDLGKRLYIDEKKAVEVALPHILNIRVIPFFPGARQVVLFGAYNNLRAINNGNTADVTVFYLSNSFFVGPQFTYSQLLASNFQVPIEVGLTRVQTSTTRQLSQPLSILSSVGLGKFDGEPLFPMGYPENLQPNIAYLTDEYTIDPYTRINYLQDPNTDPNIQMYFYATKNIDLGRAISNQPLIEKFLVPPVSPKENITVQFKN